MIVDCAVNSCNLAKKHRDWCDKHYQRWLKYGDPEYMKPNYIKERFSTIEERFNDSIDITPNHWFWTGKLNDSGYGMLSSDEQNNYGMGRKKIRAHRWSYEYYIGKIPEGAQIDYRCRIRNCVNPQHLRIATQYQNMENIDKGKRKSTSKYLNVRAKSNGKWEVRMSSYGKSYYGGLYEDEEEANKAAIKLRLEIKEYNELDRIRNIK